jgi:saccharopine dehydrogenase-like NADP-dependent oxidoreductase
MWCTIRTCCDGLVKSADLVISLLPYSLHPTVAQGCLEAGTHT